MNKKNKSIKNKYYSNNLFDYGGLLGEIVHQNDKFNRWLKKDNNQELLDNITNTYNKLNSIPTTSVNAYNVLGIPQNTYDLGGVLGIVGGAANEVNKYVNNIKGINTDSFNNAAQDFANQQVTFSSNEDALAQFANRQHMKGNLNMKDVTGKNAFQRGLGAATGLVGSVLNGLKMPFAYGGQKYGIGGAIATGVLDAASLMGGAVNNQRKLNELNNNIAAANARYDASFNTAIDNLEKAQDNALSYNYYGFGGPVFFNNNDINGAIEYDLANRKLDNDAFKILTNQKFNNLPGINNMDSVNSTYAKGGMLPTDFTNGVTQINQGGTHEMNPHEGVPAGIAPDGQNNLVEEGEVIYKDYVFSNRLKVPKEVKDKYKLRGITFADCFKYAQKEAEERPNDPISKKGLDSITMILSRTQEAIKGVEEANQFAKGGHIYAVDGQMNQPLTEEIARQIYKTPFLYNGPTWYDYTNEDYSNIFLEPRRIFGEHSILNNSNTTVNNTIQSPVSSTNTTSNINTNNSTIRSNSVATKATAIPTIPEKIALNPLTLMNAEEYANLNTRLDNIIGNQGPFNVSETDIPDYTVTPQSIPERVKTPNNYNNLLRLAPIFGNIGAVASDLMGYTNTPSKFTINHFQPVAATPLGNYVSYNPFDTRYALNIAAQNAAATRNAIMQSTSPSRNAAILAADYNNTIAQGDIYRKDQEAEYNRYLNAAQFNRDTDKINSTMGLQAATTNMQGRNQWNHLNLQKQQLNDNAETLAYQGRAANLSNLLNDIANYGRESTEENWKENLINSGYWGTMNNAMLSDPTLTKQFVENYIKEHPDVISASKGGKLKRRKKGLTY